jgi:hypothetical protein
MIAEGPVFGVYLSGKGKIRENIGLKGIQTCPYFGFSEHYPN